MTDPKSFDDSALLADGRPVIRCGCGFLAVSDDQQDNQWAYTDHVARSCPLAPVRPVVHTRQPWYGPLFSIWGLLIVFTICYAILAGTGHAKW